jgi:hypothetical protein
MSKSRKNRHTSNQYFYRFSVRPLKADRYIKTSWLFPVVSLPIRWAYQTVRRCGEQASKHPLDSGQPVCFIFLTTIEIITQNQHDKLFHDIPRQYNTTNTNAKTTPNHPIPNQ